METNIREENVYKALSDFLETNKKKFLALWEEQLILNPEDKKDLVRENGYLMYEFTIHSMINEGKESELKLLAEKVAKERCEANINIGDFVYNVNLGRSIIIKCINHSGFKSEVLQQIIDRINKQFDLFCYYAVSRYTKLLDKKINEKNLFITQTHKDRLTILGQMSSSFVHEFRNPLTSVMGFIKLLQNDYPDLPYLDIVNKELEQLKFRITQFLHTSKLYPTAETKNEEISVKQILEEVLDFLYPSIADCNIEVNSTIEGETIVNGDPNELKQVFQNLLMNAIDAVSEVEIHRQINIHTEVIHSQVVISFSNNGPVLDADAIHLIFEPFYTTKKLGTGIGLFVCKNIIEKHNGKITCFVTEDLTTFQTVLPIISNSEI
ncbi:histidine kinase N-terminal domain-containing protein [Pullulanibacillus sp. KACC 23026]|uniref:histidine kinase N-terminal domain-containing protein n=1 Tax=Pullulanibacillus sp. KACC 23026 TaxID=3028315 RepID=UPI0023B04612|nr:histidine kinase N-terminal domain-containing protein [Pullulanibacillus sp. KACC 23026]WEG11469.1 histidine kinase N-terminal domain-containing protein [Pullulanibacillus sp. KACC 23026]